MIDGNVNEATGSVSQEEIWKETRRLRDEAISAVNELSNHLEQVSDNPRMYQANRALRALWEIQ